MATMILTNVFKEKKSKIKLIARKKEFSMVRHNPIIDCVSARQRMRVPFRYRWLKFKTGFFGLVIKKGGLV